MNEYTNSKVIQVANTPEGDYDVHKPLPYPFHIAPSGEVLRQDFWQGTPARLAGFQRGEEHRVAVFAADWLKDEVDVTGMYPVFLDADGTMWSHSFPVEGDE